MNNYIENKFILCLGSKGKQTFAFYYIFTWPQNLKRSVLNNRFWFNKPWIIPLLRSGGEERQCRRSRGGRQCAGGSAAPKNNKKFLNIFENHVVMIKVCSVINKVSFIYIRIFYPKLNLSLLIIFFNKVSTPYSKQNNSCSITSISCGSRRFGRV